MYWTTGRAGRAKCRPKMPTKSIRTGVTGVTGLIYSVQLVQLVQFCRAKGFCTENRGQDWVLTECASIPAASAGQFGQTDISSKVLRAEKKEEIKRPWTTWTTWTTLFNSEDIGPIGSHDRHEPVESIWCDKEKGTKMIQTVFDCRGLTVDCDGPRTVEF